MAENVMESPYKGSGQITREQLLFYEMRITAKVYLRKLNKKSINTGMFMLMI
ncbi:MAG: hypothetical protein IJH71_03075 [Eubacterium sp.]|nr:hypothetical protein [Eubacterium sp.]